MVEGSFWAAKCGSFWAAKALSSRSFVLHVCVIIAMALVERRVRVADTAPSLRLSAESLRSLVVAPSRTVHPPLKSVFPFLHAKGNLTLNSVLRG